MKISTKEVELSWDKLRKAKKLGWAQLRAGKLLKKLTSEIYGGSKYSCVPNFSNLAQVLEFTQR